MSNIIPIDHWSPSSMSQFLRNPLSFKKQYILKIYDNLTSPSALVGISAHKAIEAYFNGRSLTEAKDIGLTNINNQSDSGINYGKTGTREQIINNYNQAVNFYFEELPTYHKILGVEFAIVAPMETVDGKTLALPAKTKSDLITENKLGEIEIIDHKFVKSYTDSSVDDFPKFIQGYFLYHTVKWKFGKAPARVIYRECKISKNRNGEPQTQEYTIEFNQMHDFATFYKLYEAATNNIQLDGYQYLPNPNDIFDGQNSFEIFRSGVIGVEAPITVEHKTEQVQFAEKNYVASAHDAVDTASFTPEGKVKAKFSEFGVGLKPEETHVGPSVTQYTFKPSIGVSMKKIRSYADDVALALEADNVRIDAPIPGTSLIGVEIPNKTRTTVPLANNHYVKGTMQIPIGVDVYGKVHHKDLADMPHLLIAGATGAGKSVMLNVILTALSKQNTATDVKFVLIDPKQVELTMFEKSKHLLMPIVTDQVQAAITLDKMVKEMERRYDVLRAAGVRNINDYTGDMPKIVIVLDEFADLMMMAENKAQTFDLNATELTKQIIEFSQREHDLNSIVLEKGVKLTKQKRAEDNEAKKQLRQMILNAATSDVPSAEHSIIRIAQKARAVGMHLILATQRPSADVVTGLIKANIPTKIAFMTTNSINSKIILDETGAEKLTGKGDMLFLDPSANGIKRLQGFYK